MGRLRRLRRLRRLLSVAVTVGVLVTLVGGVGTASAGEAHTVIPSPVPRAATPQVLDGRVLDIERVGDRIVVAGDFTRVQDAAANGAAEWAQPGVFAFDRATGRIDRSFVVALRSSTAPGVANAVAAGPGGTVFVGGTFTTVNGATARNLTHLSVATGQRTSFRPPSINGAVFDLVLAGGRLYVGGTFNTVAGVGHGGLASLNPTTGALSEYMGVDVAVNHNWVDGSTGARGSVGVRDMAVSPDGSRLVAIGNFKLADGQPRDQAVAILLQADGAVVDPGWRTRRYEPACFSWAYDFYVREVDFSPDGRYFVIVTTGGHNAGTLCDTAARWDVADTGDDVQPRWAADAGGDTLHSVVATGAAVYVGGHQRWMNNRLGNDSPGAGAVPRPGLAALDPRTGVPLAWNPGRNPRGIGAEAMLATADGLYVGSDTEFIGNYAYKRPRLAFFPLAGGASPAAEEGRALPANVYLGGRPSAPSGGGDTGDVLFRVNAGGPALPALDGGPTWAGDSGDLRNSGSNPAGWAPGAAVDGSVPSSTPPEVFDSERWDPGEQPEMQWQMPVVSGLTVEVRLYFANRCSCTDEPGERMFDVAIDGEVVLDDYDIVADVGDQTGTMKSFVITSDGTVDISFGHVTENPLVNAIEVLESTGAPAPVEPTVDDLVARWFDGSKAGPDTAAPAGGLQWGKVRGAFVVGDRLYYGYPDEGGAYSLYRRSFDGTSYGAAEEVDPYDDPVWRDVDTASGQTYRGTRSAFYGQLSSVTGMFFHEGRLYYSRAGRDGLFWRGFSLDSGVVGVDESAAASTGFAAVSGMFLAGNSLYTGDRTTGELRRVRFADGAPAGEPSVVGGPAVDGRSWAGRALFAGPGAPPPAPNEPPTAAFAFDCAGTSCSFDGARSSDPDGRIQAWSWDFGDGGTGAGARVQHEFRAAGRYEVALTVTDDDLAKATSTQTVVVEVPPPASGIALRGSVGTSARPATRVSVDVPTAVRQGDGLVLVLSTNSAVTGTPPAGWALAATQTDGGRMTTQVFSRVATASDAGSRVTVTVPESSALSLQLLAYSGTAQSGPVASVTGAATGSGTAHTTPTAQAQAGAVVVSVWSDKGASAREFTAPAGTAVRSNLAGGGNGDVATLVADSGPVPAGRVGGLTATVPTSSSRSTALTVVLAPAPAGPPPPPPNEEPMATIGSECAALECSFDASRSTDPDGSVTSHTWSFGDGRTAQGAVVRHTYAAAGDYTVTLTVTDDDGATATATATVTVAAPPTGGAIGLRGSSGVAARPVTRVSVDVPTAVRAGDGLVLVLTTNSSVTGATPPGWRSSGTQTDGGRITTQVFSRVATAEDAGRTVTVDVGGVQSALVLQLMAYSGTAPSGPVLSVTGAASGSGTSHTTPTATAPAGAWVMSVWADKSAVERQWVPPTGLAPRSNIAGAGNGDVAALVADSGGPVAGGRVGGLTATVPTASSRATVLTLVLAPPG